jgi:hypothetical protein
MRLVLESLLPKIIGDHSRLQFFNRILVGADAQGICERMAVLDIAQLKADIPQSPTNVPSAPWLFSSPPFLEKPQPKKTTPLFDEDQCYAAWI